MQQAVRERLIKDHMDMAAAIASDCAGRFNLLGLVSYGDMLGYAQQGLVEAANRYAPETGTKFRSYSWPRIKGAIIDGVRKSGRDGYRRVDVGLGRAHPDVMLARDGDRETEEIVDESLVSDSPEADLDARRVRAVLRRAIESLPPRHREVCIRHYYQGEDLTEISRTSGLSTDYIGRIHTSALRELRSALSDVLRDYVSEENAR